MGPENRVWTNSVFGRIYCSLFGIYCLVLPVVVDPPSGGSQIASVVTTSVILAIGVLMIVGVWTSRLTLADGVLTARNFGVSRSIRLADVESMEPAFFPTFGMVIEGPDGRRVRTLVSGEVGNELWVPRATKICDEIVELAELARSSAAA